MECLSEKNISFQTGVKLTVAIVGSAIDACLKK